MAEERIQKILAQAGFGSRRDCEELILEGRVTVGGRVVAEVGVRADPRRDEIKVDGRRVRPPAPVYLLLHKPKGVVCTAAESDRGRRAIDFAPRGAGRVHTIGRLDRDSEGLLVLTNDGALTERLTHPRHEVPKTYHVLVRGKVAAEALAKLRKGIWLAEGKARASRLGVLRATPAATLLEIELREGKKREIRRIMAKVGHPVKHLRRVAIGPIRIGRLKPGEVRPLRDDEVRILREAVGLAERGARAEVVREARPERRPAPGPGKKREGKKREGKKRSEAGDRAPPAPRYVPDEEGVIVVRRPPVRFEEEE